MLRTCILWLCFFLELVGIIYASPPDTIDWDLLADVEYDFSYEESLNTWYGTPTFGEAVKKLNGKPIIITGYVIPVDITGGLYMLSAFPYQSCFFCGAAGQESIMELRFKNKKRKFTIDEVQTFQGILFLNDKELEMSYILNEAELYP